MKSYQEMRPTVGRIKAPCADGAGRFLIVLA